MNSIASSKRKRSLTGLVKTAIASFVGGNASLNRRAGTKGWVSIDHTPVVLTRLDEAFDNYRLVQFSDVHLDGWLDREKLAEVVDLVNALRPDLVAITGDFFTHSPESFASALSAELGRLKAADGVVAVLGNHDHWSGANVARKALRDSGVYELDNRIYTLNRGDACLHVAGVDDYMVGKDRLDLLLEGLPEQGAAILLAHEPDYADISAASGRFDLQISGHSHGGQVRLPLIGSPFLPHHARKYPAGRYQVGEMVLYTNRGLGMVHFPARVNSPPEITVYRLLSRDKA